MKRENTNSILYQTNQLWAFVLQTRKIHSFFLTLLLNKDSFSRIKMVTIKVTDADYGIELAGEDEIELEEKLENETKLDDNSLDEKEQSGSNDGKSEGSDDGKSEGSDEGSDGSKGTNLESGSQTNQDWRKNFKVRVQPGAPMFR